MININNIKKARKILSDEFNLNKDLWETKNMVSITTAMGELDVLVQKLRKGDIQGSYSVKRDLSASPENLCKKCNEINNLIRNMGKSNFIIKDEIVRIMENEDL